MADRLSNTGRARVAGMTTASFLLGALAPVTAQAATATAAAAATASAAAPEVSGVTVTGKREASNAKLTAPLIQTPKSVTVIPQTLISDSGLTTLNDALRTIPGITFASGEGGTSAGDRPVIRGIDSTNDIFVDGVRDSGTGSRETFAVESVEVIKGPGSAYTGRGSTGGSINIITKTPKAGVFASATAVVGTDQTHRVTGDVNYAFSDNVAVRLNVMAHENEVAGRDAVHGDRWGVAPSLALGLNSATRATLTYYHLSTDELPDYGLPYNPVTLKPLTGHDDSFWGLTRRDFRKTTSDIGMARFEHDLGGGFVVSNASRWGRNTYDQVVTNPDDTRGNVPNGFLFRSSKNRNVRTTSIANVTELRGGFDTGAVKHTILGGLEFSQEKTHNQGYFVNGPGLAATAGFAPVPPAGVISGTAGCSNPARVGAAFGYNCTTLANPNPDDPWVGSVTRSPAYTDTRTKTQAIYLFDTLDFGPHWSLNLGVRYDRFDTRATGVTATAATTAPYIVLAPAVPAANKSDFVNYQVGLVYKPSDRGSVYVSYGTSSNPSGEGAGDSSVVAVATQNLDPEENRSVEVGAKWAFFEGLTATVAAFRTEKTNARVTDALGATALIGETRIDGFEVGLSGQITPAWTVFGGLSLLKGKTVDGGFAAGGLPSPNTGKKLPNTPETAFTLTSNYQLTPALMVGGSAQYMSERFGDPANTRRIDAYWAFDAVAAYDVTEKLTLQLNLRNLTDERYVTNAFQTHMVQIAAGRTALLSASYRF